MSPAYVVDRNAETENQKAMTAESTKSNEARSHGERRQTTRFHLQGEAWFEWETAAEPRREGVGTTRNVGREGAYIETETPPPVASDVKIIVTFSRGQGDEFQMRLWGCGTVRHVQGRVTGNEGFGAWVPFHNEPPFEAA